MPASTDILDQLIDAARRDVIATVDLFLDKSSTLEDFERMWVPTKGLYEEHGSATAVEIARRVGAEVARELRDALAVLEEHRPS